MTRPTDENAGTEVHGPPAPLEPELAEVARTLAAAGEAGVTPPMPTVLVESLAHRHRVTMVKRGIWIGLVALIVLAVMVLLTSASDDAALASAAVEAEETEQSLVQRIAEADRTRFMLLPMRERGIAGLDLPVPMTDPMTVPTAPPASLETTESAGDPIRHSRGTNDAGQVGPTGN